MVNRIMAGIATVALVLTATVASSVATAQSAEAAADVSSFDAGDLVSDTIFYDGGATKAGTIQHLLDSEGGACKAVGSLRCLRDLTVTIPKSAGDQYCGAIASHVGQSAATVFATVGEACSINPAVLVVLVQKEQSLVTRATPSTPAYEHATGYNCPDTAACSTATAGFYTQVYHAAKQFQRYRQNPGDFSFRAGRYNTIAFHSASVAGCGSSRVYIENAATAGLYDYTPYQPNKAALANLAGTGDGCSSYGNRNFWRDFNDWFGNTGNLLKASSFEASVKGWSFGTKVSRALKGSASGASDAQAGQYYLAANTSTSGSSIYQTVTQALTAGHLYSGSIWLRSSSATVPVTGKLALWGLGGSSENAVTSFSVGSTWTQVTANLIPRRSGHRQLRLQVYLSTTHTTLELDAADLGPLPVQPARGGVALSSPSFEQGVGAWKVENGAMHKAIYDIPAAAQNGPHFLAMNTSVSGRSIGQTVKRAPVRGETYTSTVWMRSGTRGVPVRGTLALWALGGHAENATTSFTVGDAWTPVLVNLPIMGSGHTSLRLQTYLSTTGHNLDLDNASLTANLVANGSFEASAPTFAASSGTSSIATVAADPSVPGLIAGAREATVSVPASGNSVAETITRRLTAGETYTASVWMRTADPTQTFSGKLALWALGGTQQNAVAPVTVSGVWTKVQVQLKIAGTTNSQLRVELYSTSPSVVADLDGLVLQ